MTKTTKSSVFNSHTGKPETVMEKTSRIARKLIDDAAEQRQVKMAQLRNARLKKEAAAPPQSIDKTASKKR